MKGFYRHHNGHVYFIYGIGINPHEGGKRYVVYTSVKTLLEGYDFLIRHYDEFFSAVFKDDGFQQRFEIITDTEHLKIERQPK